MEGVYEAEGENEHLILVLSRMTIEHRRDLTLQRVAGISLSSRRGGMFFAGLLTNLCRITSMGILMISDPIRDGEMRLGTLPLMRHFFLSILKLTMDNNRFSLEDLSRTAKMPAHEIRTQVKRYSHLGMVTFEQEIVLLDIEKRLSIALEALKIGADLERVCRFLSWQEFEEITVKSLRSNGFSTFKHFVFESNDHRREIDVIGVGHFLVVCLDCKHWLKGIRGAAGQRVAVRQIERVQRLTSHEQSMSRLRIPAGKEFYFVPVIVSLVDAGPRFIARVPVVPVLKLGSFLSSIDPFIDGLFAIKVRARLSQDEHTDSSRKRC